MRINNCITNSIVLFLLLMPITKADTLVLIHGYQSSSERWTKEQVTEPLYQAGWQYGGNYTGSIKKLVAPQNGVVSAKGKVFVTVDLPSEAPIAYQMRILDQYLQHLYRQRKEPLILVGHSAGGVVARAWLTYPSVQPVSALITIATPHMGTPLAGVAFLGSKTPLNGMSRMMGLQSMDRSKGLFKDLKVPKPNNFLYWLNRQVYPNIKYISIIRRSKPGFRQFDALVPRASQNMNNVVSLKGRSSVLLSDGSHGLSKNDGYNILLILERMK